MFGFTGAPERPDVGNAEGETDKGLRLQPANIQGHQEKSEGST